MTQAYTVNIMEESVLRGNAVILKCHISTFVTEYVSVSSWIISEGDIEELEIKPESKDLGIILLHSYFCPLLFPIISFFFKYTHYFNSITISVVSQAYTVNLMEENVLRGNSAIVKCHIPSFVTEYVTVSSWIISEGDVDEAEIKQNESLNLGIF